MTTVGYVLCGEDRLPFALAAIEALGMASGDRVTALDQLRQLADAEAAHYEVRDAIYRAQRAAILGGA